MARSRVWDRRRFLTTGGAIVAGAWLAGCTSGDSSPSTAAPVSAPSGRLMSPTDPAIAAREAERRSAGGGATAVDLTARPMTVDLGGIVVDTTGYGDSVPGPVVRVRAGDELTVRFRNQLTDPTVIHWHGLAIRNDMDGVPHLTQDPIPGHGEFTYRFVVPDPGTYWFHPHMGLDLDRGLYAPIIVDDPGEPGDYDDEEILILDDWIDGIDGASPDTVLADLEAARLTVNQQIVSVEYELIEDDLKTASSRRTIDLDEQTIAMLRRHRRHQLEQRMATGQRGDDDFVFAKTDGSPVHPDLISQTFQRFMAQTDLTKIRLHDLRHTHATILLQQNVHPKVVSERLGHSSIAFTMTVYQHVMPGMQAAAAATFGAAVFGE